MEHEQERLAPRHASLPSAKDARLAPPRRREREAPSLWLAAERIQRSSATPVTINASLSMRPNEAGRTGRARAEQPVVGEARGDPAADQHDQRDKCRDTGAQAVIRRAGDQHLGVKGDVGDCAEDRSARAASDSANCCPTTISRAMTRSRQGRKRLSMTTAASGTRHPVARRAIRARHQSEKRAMRRNARDRQPPGPVRHRRQEKAGHHGRRIAEAASRERARRSAP